MDRIRKWLCRVPIPAAFMICGLSCLLAALALTKVTVWFAQKNMNEIAEVQDLQLVPMSDILYQDADHEVEYLWEESEPAQEVNEPEQEMYLTDIPQEAEILGTPYIIYNVQAAAGSDQGILLGQEGLVVNIGTVKAADRGRYDFFVGLDDIAAVLWYSVCLCLAALIFYFWKIKKPLRTLNYAVQKISENDLNYRIEYDGQDEFGRLCHAFELMRQELVHNNQKLWNSVEERKRLNAAFAHDLRTPLTILKGHTDLMEEILSEDAAAARELKGSVSAISRQVTRLNAFVDTMGALQRLEDYEPCPRPVPSSSLTKLVSETAALLFPQGRVEIHSELADRELRMDQEVFAQICENILSNAARYARERIWVSLCEDQEFLILSVEDDGIGFSRKDQVSASFAYYRGEKTGADAASHFGLGLYICQLLAEKLGGSLQLCNGSGGGAKVTVKMHCI